MKIEFLPEAKDELEDAIAYYELQVTGLGKTFKDVAKSTILRISQFPTAWSEIRPKIRRCIMHKFPYNVLYTIEKDFILIVAIAHHHRKPDYWQKRAD
jgi:plasmid stabilization system protein ParE